MSTFEPIREVLTIEADQERAFHTFVGRLADWWPVDTYAMAPGEVRDVRVEQWVGGRIYEVHRDGGECDWGRVTTWKPPEAVSFTWEVIPGPGRTEVELGFQCLGPALTRVVLAHRGWEHLSGAMLARYGAYSHGWAQILGRFVAMFRADQPTTH